MIQTAKKWAIGNNLQLAIFNLFVMLLIMFRSAGYFVPFFLISINFIILSSLVLSVALFKLRSNFMFMVATSFLFFALLVRFLKVEIWAERTAIYAFQALVVAVFLLISEFVFQKDQP